MADMNNNVVNTDSQVENPTTENNTQAEAEKTYTKDEVMALLQQEADRRVSSALKKQAAKYEKQLSLSKLDGDEREKAEKDSVRGTACRLPG